MKSHYKMPANSISLGYSGFVGTDDTSNDFKQPKRLGFRLCHVLDYFGRIVIRVPRQVMKIGQDFKRATRLVHRVACIVSNSSEELAPVQGPLRVFQLGRQFFVGEIRFHTPSDDSKSVRGWTPRRIGQTDNRNK
jgi:hypothetical protein